MTVLARAIAALGLLFAARLFGGSKSREPVVREPIVRFAIEHPWLTTGAMAAGAMAIGAIAVIAGVAPIKASSGHWAITAALLDFAKVRSVRTHARGIDAPPLDDESLVIKGAGQYEIACRQCHDGPGRGLPAIPAAMTPSPPALSTRLARWTSEELFSIVKHGIKFTGMPAWPAQQRDDEVWAMVAFLRRMPQLDGPAYRKLALGDPGALSDESSILSATAAGSPPLVVREGCAPCHGADGTGRGLGASPSLAGQRAEYLYASLRAYADRRRFSGIMTGIAANLTEREMRTAASYYAGLPARVGDVGDSTRMARGAAIASQGVPERDIPACAECHGPANRPKNPTYPRLAGQHAGYLAQQLRLLQQRRRGGSPNVTLMQVFVDRLGEDEIADVTQYYASGAAPLGQ